MLESLLEEFFVKIVSIVGARPQFVKLAPIHEAASGLERGELEHIIVHTGQHYDYAMSGAFFDGLSIPEPDENLGIGSGAHGAQTGKMLAGLEEVMVRREPDLVMLYGDTNSTLAGALAAAKLHIPVVHVEAGLRSRNKAMPEEVNRVLTDHVSSILFCPTIASVGNLATEGLGAPQNEGHLIPAGFSGYRGAPTPDSPWIVHVGDVMKDAVIRNAERAKAVSTILADLGLEGREYTVATVHRAENTDDRSRLESILAAREEIARDGHPVILPLHPRTAKAMDRYGLTRRGAIRCIDPLPYLDMLRLLAEARLVLTDSGGLQKEAFLLRVACVTLREETEWVELVDAGWNRLAGTDAPEIIRAAREFLSTDVCIDPPGLYGDGRAAERIIKICLDGWERVHA